MSNLPPGCTQEMCDRAMGWRPRRECRNIVEEWAWDCDNGADPEWTWDHWHCLMALPAEYFREFDSNYSVQDRWADLHKTKENP